METITVKQPLTFNAGAKLKLIPQQVSTRPLKLASTDEDDVYIVLDRIVFKCGEVIGLVDGEEIKTRADEEKIVRNKPARKNPARKNPEPDPEDA